MWFAKEKFGGSKTFSKIHPLGPIVQNTVNCQLGVELLSQSMNWRIQFFWFESESQLRSRIFSNHDEFSGFDLTMNLFANHDNIILRWWIIQIKSGKSRSTLLSNDSYHVLYNWPLAEWQKQMGRRGAVTPKLLTTSLHSLCRLL